MVHSFSDDPGDDRKYVCGSQATDIPVWNTNSRVGNIIGHKYYNFVSFSFCRYRLFFLLSPKGPGRCRQPFFVSSRNAPPTNLRDATPVIDCLLGDRWSSRSICRDRSRSVVSSLGCSCCSVSEYRFLKWVLFREVILYPPRYVEKYI